MPRKSRLDVEVNKKELAGIFEVSESSITIYEKYPGDPLPFIRAPKRGTPNKYSLREATTWFAKHRLPEARYAVAKLKIAGDTELDPEDFGDAEGINGIYEKARLTKEQADAQAIKNELLRGSLILKEDVVRMGAPIAQVVKSKLDSIPMQVKKALPHLGAQELTTIKRLIVEASNAAAKFTTLGTELASEHTDSDE